MKKPSHSTAMLRTMAAVDGKNLTTKRLQKDYYEMVDSDTPCVGISGHPLDDDYFTWHCNLAGPEKTCYAGAVIHLEMKIPETYPKDPPTINLLTPLKHPNVFGTTLCLDMLQKNTARDQNVGWSSAYGIQSILVQLQSFLFEGH